MRRRSTLPRRAIVFRLAAAVAVAACTGCTRTKTRSVDGGAPESTGPFRVEYLGKSDVDMVLEIQLEDSFSDLQTLMLKLYRRNPREWAKAPRPSMHHTAARVFDGRMAWNFPEFSGKQGSDCIQLAFDESWTGDRVLAFTVGLASMLLASYNGKVHFFLVDSLDPQKLYNSARNVEIATWKLNNDVRANGAPFLLSNSRDGEVRNLSYERLLAKVIARQDTAARVVSDKTNRGIKFVLQKVAGAVFLPI